MLSVIVTLFLEAEERKIYEDFDRLGYSKSFVTRARLSARQGRDREVRIRQGLEQPKPPRERSRFYITLPYNRTSNNLSYRFGLRGVDVSFTNRDSIKNRISSRVRSTTNSGIYALTCKKESCGRIYVGQSQNIPKRLQDHTNAKHRSSMSYYTSVKHTFRGHELEPSHAKVPYKSNSLSHRLVIETCLISLCYTVIGNKASSNNRDMNILAPIILRSSPVDWKVLSEIQPGFNPEVVPRTYRKFFSSNTNDLHHSDMLPSSEGTSPNTVRFPISTFTGANSFLRSASPDTTIGPHTGANNSLRSASPDTTITHSYFTRLRASTQC